MKPGSVWPGIRMPWRNEFLLCFARELAMPRTRLIPCQRGLRQGGDLLMNPASSRSYGASRPKGWSSCIMEASELAS
jgi:hypothetical protein